MNLKKKGTCISFHPRRGEAFHLAQGSLGVLKKKGKRRLLFLDGRGGARRAAHFRKRKKKRKKNFFYRRQGFLEKRGTESLRYNCLSLY